MKIKNSILIDLILIGILMISSIYFLVEMIMGGLIPMKFILLICLILLIIVAIVFVTFKLGKKMALFRRIFLGLLCILLVAGSVFQTRIRLIFNGIETNDTNTSIMRVLVLKDSELNSLSSLEDKRVGYVDDDQLLTDYAVNEVMSHRGLVEDYKQLDDVFSDLDTYMIDAMLISDRFYTVESEKDDFYDMYRVIADIEMVTENNEVGSEKDLSKEPFTVYITGMDSTGKPNYDGLSDVNMILMIDPDKHHVEMISIPRDAYVPNPLMNYEPDKLTHLGWNGSDGLVQAVEAVVGFDIDYYAKVSFSSLIEIVDTLGGINVDVQLEFTEQNENRDYANGGFVNTIHLYPGMQTLNGREALAYARHRYTDGWGDLGRTMAQRQIIEAIVSKLFSAEGIAKVTDVLEVGSQYVATNMPMSYVKDFVNYEIGNLRAWTFSSTAMSNGLGAGNQACASMGFVPLWVYLLSEYDLDMVYTKYMQMYDGESLANFGFDLNDLNAGSMSAPRNQYLVTYEDYYSVLSAYFPEYLEFASQDFSTEEETDEEFDEEGNPIDPNTPPTDNDTLINPDGPMMPGEVEDPTDEDIIDEPVVEDPVVDEPFVDGPSAPDGMEE